MAWRDDWMRARDSVKLLAATLRTMCSIADAVEATGYSPGTISRWARGNPQLVAQRNRQGHVSSVYYNELMRLVAASRRKPKQDEKMDEDEYTRIRATKNRPTKR